MLIIDMPKLFERPPIAVYAFMAGLSVAAGVSARLYVDQLATLLMQRKEEP